jgi:hypothetical protein
MADRLISPRRLFGPDGKAPFSESTARRTPGFPKPIVISRTKSGKPARVAYVESEVDAFIASLIAQARGAA